MSTTESPSATQSPAESGSRARLSLASLLPLRWPGEVQLARNPVGAATLATRTVAQATVETMRMVPDRLGFAGVAGSRGTVWNTLRHKQFFQYFLGSLISNFGTWLQNTAQMLLAYQLTHSVFTVGLVTCAQFSSPLILGPWAGVLADRIGSKHTLVSTQVIATFVAATLAVLEFTHALTEPALLACAFVTGLLFTLALPAQSVIIPALMPRADEENETKSAVAMNSVSYNAGRMLAPAFSVLIVTTIGFGWAFMLNAASFAVFTIVILVVRPCADLPAPTRSRVRDGFYTAWDERKISILLLMVAAVTLADDPVLVLGPALAHHVGKSDDWSGWFLSALGAGSVLGSLLPRWRVLSARRAATALAVLGFSMMTFALAPWIWLSIAAAFAAGIAGLVAGSTAQAMLIELAGPVRALRVMGLWTMAWAGSKPIASIIDGALPSVVGLRMTGFILATPSVLPILLLIFCPVLVNRLVRRRPPLNTASSEPDHETVTSAPSPAISCQAAAQ